MAYLKYECLVTHYTDKFYKKGLVYLFPEGVDPGARFEAASGDPIQGDEIGMRIDRDGTLYAGRGLFNWDDFRFPLTQSKTGANLKPDYDENENGYAFPNGDTTEILRMSQITSHRKMIGPDVIWYPHLHFQQDEAQIPVFEYRYRIAVAGGTIPAFSAWIPTLNEVVFGWSSGKIHQIIEFPPIKPYALGFQTPAAIVDIQLRRNDIVVVGDVIAKEFDFHTPMDAILGSGQQFIK